MIENHDRKAIEQVIAKAYLQGIHGDQDEEKVKSGFHQDFAMLVRKENALEKVTVDEWLARVEVMKRENPGLWEAESTTDADRKEIIRQVIDRVVIDTQGSTEKVRVVIEWAGGTCTQGEMIRPVGKLERLSYYPELCDRVRALAAALSDAA